MMSACCTQHTLMTCYNLAMAPDPTLRVALQTALWGGVGSEVLDLTLHKDVKRVKDSPYAWAIAL
jgi:hypothetical protein